MSLWRNKEKRKKDAEEALSIREQCDEYDRTGEVAEKPKFKSGGLVADAVAPEIFSPYTRHLVSTKTLLALVGVEPNFDGVGDEPIDEGDVMYGECAWCGGGMGPGGHKPDCKSLTQNWSRSSLGTQREMTQRLRSEMDQRNERTFYQGSWEPEKRAKLVKPEPPKDVRTEMQKRFDAIAEELDESK